MTQEAHAALWAMFPLGIYRELNTAYFDNSSCSTCGHLYGHPATSETEFACFGDCRRITFPSLRSLYEHVRSSRCTDLEDLFYKCEECWKMVYEPCDDDEGWEEVEMMSEEGFW
jgi:hypothetical protein